MAFGPIGIPERGRTLIQPTAGVRAETDTAALWGQLAQQASNVQNALTDRRVMEERRAATRYLADFENSQRRAASDLREKRRYDPAGFEEDWRNHTDGALSEIDASIVPEAKNLIAQIGERTRDELLREKSGRDEALTKRSVFANIDLESQDLLGAAASGADASVVEKLQTQVRDKFGAAVASGLLSQEEADRRFQTVSSEAAGQAAVAQVQSVYRAGGAEAARKFVSEGIVAGEKLGITAADAWKFRNRADRMVDEWEAERRRDQREATAAAREMRMELKEDARGLMSDFAAGARPSLERVEQTAAALERTGAPIEAARLRQRYQSARALNDFANRPLLQQERILNGELKEALDSGEIEGWLYQEAQQAFTRKREGLARDPLGTMDSIGSVNLSPINWLAPDQQWSAAIADRNAAAGKVEELEGLNPIPPFTAVEIDTLKRTLDAADVNGKASIIGRLASSLPRERLNATLAKIAPDRPVVAWAGGLYRDAPELSASILRGEAAIKADPKTVPLEDQAYTDAVSSYMGSAMTALPKARAAAVDAARARYADLSLQAGDASGKLDTDRLEQALQDVVGRTVEWNGQKVVAPRGLDDDGFERLMDGLTDADLGAPSPVALDGSPVTTETIRDLGTLVDYGDGRYLVQIGGRFALTPDQRPYVLDLRGKTGNEP